MGDRRHDVALRRLCADDCAWVAALIREAFATLRVDPAPSALRVSEAAIAVHLAACGGGTVVDPGRACLLWLPRDGSLYVSRVAVRPADRGQGLATALIQAAEAEARRLGVARLWLSTRLAAAGSRRLFARCGLVEGARHAHPGYAEPTFVEMEKRLGTALPGPWGQD